MANGWTQERRERQSEAIQRWKPWKKSTGPRTPDGKLSASQNAFKGGIRPELRAIAKALRNQQNSLDELTTDSDMMIEEVVDADPWAMQELAETVDE